MCIHRWYLISYEAGDDQGITPSKPVPHGHAQSNEAYPLRLVIEFDIGVLQQQSEPSSRLRWAPFLPEDEGVVRLM